MKVRNHHLFIWWKWIRVLMNLNLIMGTLLLVLMGILINLILIKLQKHIKMNLRLRSWNKKFKNKKESIEVCRRTWSNCKEFCGSVHRNWTNSNNQCAVCQLKKMKKASRIRMQSLARNWPVKHSSTSFRVSSSTWTVDTHNNSNRIFMIDSIEEEGHKCHMKFKEL